MKEGKLKGFLQKIGKPLSIGLDLVGDVTDITAFNKLSDAISGSSELTEQEKTQALEMLKMDYSDRDSARQMQAVALNQDDLFSKRFVYYIASFWSLIGAIFIMAILFKDIPHENVRLIDTILGFLMGTIISGIMQFFFGSSAGSAEKSKHIEKLIRK